jgi:hypothetical protein
MTLQGPRIFGFARELLNALGIASEKMVMRFLRR